MKIRLRILTARERNDVLNVSGLPLVTVYESGAGFSGTTAMLEQWNEFTGGWERVEVAWQ